MYHVHCVVHTVISIRRQCEGKCHTSRMAIEKFEEEDRIEEGLVVVFLHGVGGCGEEWQTRLASLLILLTVL